MLKFKKGDGQLTFTTKKGKKFIKTFHSASARTKAYKAWQANGGKKPKLGTFKGR